MDLTLDFFLFINKMYKVEQNQTQKQKKEKETTREKSKELPDQVAVFYKHLN